MALVTLFLGCLIWTILTIVTIRAGEYTIVFISTGCVCTSLVLLLMLFIYYLHSMTPDPTTAPAVYTDHHVITIRPKTPATHTLVALGGDVLHVHVAASQSSPGVLAIAFLNAFDERASSHDDTAVLQA